MDKIIYCKACEYLAEAFDNEGNSFYTCTNGHDNYCKKIFPMNSCSYAKQRINFQLNNNNIKSINSYNLQLVNCDMTFNNETKMYSLVLTYQKYD